MNEEGNPLTDINGTIRRCQHVKGHGQRCKANAMRSSPYCFFHDPSKAKERAAARRAGGVQRSQRAAVLPPDTPDHPLRTSGEVAELVAEMINKILRGELDPKIGSAVGYLLTLQIKALGQGEVEERLAALEMIIKQKPIELNGVLDEEPKERGIRESDGEEDEEPPASRRPPEIN